MLTLDGSRGEGGGQILRTALALSMVTGKAFRMNAIRAGRKKPGMMRQHLTCVQAAQRVCHAHVRGAEIGSTTLTFEPGPISSGTFEFAVGTAGSTTLVLQTIFAALMQADGPSHVRITGGTHNPMAPSADFIERVWLPTLAGMGVHSEFRCTRPGFFPAGGGQIEATVHPGRAAKWTRLAGNPRVDAVWAAVAELAQGIAHRELVEVAEHLGLDRARMEVRRWDAASAGNVICVEVDSDGQPELIFGLGERGKEATAVAADVVNEVRQFLKVGAPVGEHLADQLILPLALGEGGVFRTGPPSRHTTTQIDTVRMFLDVDIQCELVDPDRRVHEVRVAGR